ncbi:aminoacyl--tRNA ligase-related protein [Bacillus sp. DJP31]|uniref:aminoacyl--tRNA ligase-related protein n=1 Tax=Bacillus sp. DJP31 TaxID=3409789 RepID=UPI003BB4A3E6
MNYKVSNGIYNLDFKLSGLEKKIQDEYCELLEEKGFNYLSIPSTIRYETFLKQEAQPPEKTLLVDDRNHKHGHCLSGSAETGILEYFENNRVEPMFIYAKNSCFRYEKEYIDLIRTKEFTKIEQYCFCEEKDWKEKFHFLLDNATSFLEKHDIQYRVIDVTDQDEGYHKQKFDVQIWSVEHGWIESHSCTYFGNEQTKRFNITGATHTISNTGIASPRILIPFIEKAKVTV